jgi:DNA-binding MarR family transcriptional regulator
MKSKKLCDENVAKAWRMMFDFLMSSAPERMESLRRHGLTANDARALFTLEPGEGRPIGALARDWYLDPSTATWLVDRLERAGLAERVPSQTDRRVKLIRATLAGAATKQELMQEYYQPPSELSALSPKELRELIALMEKLSTRQK